MSKNKGGIYIKFRRFLVFLLCAALLSGCRMSPEKLTRQVERKMGKVKTYHLKAEAEIFSGEASQVYQLEQWFEEPDSYRLEIKDEDSKQILISTGGETWIYHSELEDYYKLSGTDEEETDPPYLLSTFWKNLIKAGKIEILGKENIPQGNVYVLEVIPQIQEVRWYTEKVWLDQKEFIPWLIEVYDDQGNKKSVFRYEEVTLNEEVDSDLFITEYSQKEAFPECEVAALSLEEARENFPFPTLIPAFLPDGAHLKVVALNEEPSFTSLIINYQGPRPFSIIQQALSGPEEEIVEAGSAGISIGNIYVYFREDLGINTLYWSSGAVRYFITGELEIEHMLEVAASMIE